MSFKALTIQAKLIAVAYGLFILGLPISMGVYFHSKADQDIKHFSQYLPKTHPPMTSPSEALAVFEATQGFPTAAGNSTQASVILDTQDPFQSPPLSTNHSFTPLSKADAHNADALQDAHNRIAQLEAQLKHLQSTQRCAD